MNAQTSTIECRTSVLRARGRLVVCCEVDHFMSSGLTAPELFARLRPQLTEAIEDAAARDPDADGTSTLPSVGMDVDDQDPGITLWVRSPAAALADLDECFDRLGAIVTRFAADGAARWRSR
jgi:hypothetical protein